MAHVLGMDCKMYYNTGGVSTSTGWTELTNAKDVTLNLSKDEADVTTRNNNGWKATVPTLKDGSVEFQMVWDDNDAGFTALKNAYFNDTNIGMEILDGARTASTVQGLKANMAVTNFSREEPLDGATLVNVTVKPGYSATAAEWTTDPDSYA